MQKEYVLYGTSGCHLCEEAEAIVSRAIKNHNIIYLNKDIVEDDDLLNQYALTIPVFSCQETREELNWPFTEEAINAFIRQ
jgi:hypothetical protein